MTLDLNDPRLTAYALGELDDAERAEIEAEVTQSDTLRRAVADIRATADLLLTELQKEPLMHLTDPQKTAIHRAAESTAAPMLTTPAPNRMWFWTLKAPLAIAATLAVLIGGTWYLVPSLSRSRELASPSLLTQANLPAPPAEETLSQRSAELSEMEELDRSVSFFSQKGGTETLTAQLRAPQSFMKESQNENEYADSESSQTAEVRTYPFNPAVGTQPQQFAGGPTTTDPNHVRHSYDATAPTSTALGCVVSARTPQRVGGMELEVIGGAAPNIDLQRTRPNVDGRLQALGYAGRGANVVEHYSTSTSGPNPNDFDNSTDGVDTPVTISGLNIATGYVTVQPSVAGSGYESFTPESYAPIPENPFLLVAQSPLSTFSIDVDTASYANVRRFLNAGSLPPPGAVRIEELINYFDYAYPQPTDEHPFSVNVDVGLCPWKQDHYLARVGLKGYEVPANERPAANLVFLIDVSGSMQPANRLPLVKEGLKLLVGQLYARDRVALVVYAGASGLVLPSTPVGSRGAILAALDQLQAGGGTNGGAGIQLAYDTADANYIEGGVNRVILATDGDFNVGITSQEQLVQLIEDQAKTGVFLSVLGFGMGNLKDSTLEKLADKGNGNYAYIDTIDEAQKVLVDQIGGTLVTIAKDVKIQIEFNPLAVSAYRLIGYENRVLAAQDFNDDQKDAGEIGAGHTVTALYELVPAGAEVEGPSIDPLKYQLPAEPAETTNDDELMTVKLRYKEPEEDVSNLIERPVMNPFAADARTRPALPSADFQFASAVAAFGMLLRNSEHAGDATFDTVLTLASPGLSNDPAGDRAEFIELVTKAQALRAASDR